MTARAAANMLNAPCKKCDGLKAKLEEANNHYKSLAQDFAKKERELAESRKKATDLGDEVMAKGNEVNSLLRSAIADRDKINERDSQLTVLNDEKRKADLAVERLTEELRKAQEQAQASAFARSFNATSTPMRLSFENSGATSPSIGRVIDAQTAEDIKGNGHIPNDERRVVVQMYANFCAALPDAEKSYVVAHFINKFKTSWRNVTPTTIHQWTNDIANGIIRNSKSDTNAPKKKKARVDAAGVKLTKAEELKVALTEREATRVEWFNVIIDLLQPLLQLNAVYTLTHATDYLDSVWPCDSPFVCPSRSTIARAMHKHNLLLTRINQGEMTSEEASARIITYRHDLALLIEKFKVLACMVINIDESALRLLPEAHYAWCLNGEQSGQSLLNMFPLICKSLKLV